MKNTILELIKKRHCKRVFLDKDVSEKTIEDILSAATHAASSKNSQPWQLSVITGQSKETLVQKMCQKFDADTFESPDYVYMTSPMPDLYHERARDCGYSLFKLKNIDKNDSVARKAHNRENYRFFGAPVAIIFHLHANAERGNFLDLGLFMQNLMLGLVSEGLGSCPQYSITQYSDTIKSHLGIDPDRIIVCGMAVGYPDPDHPVNDFIPKRAALDDFVRWHR